MSIVSQIKPLVVKVLKDLYGVFSDDVRIIYGGSVDRVNADRLVREGNVAGLLVGRQSLVCPRHAYFDRVFKADDRGRAEFNCFSDCHD